jgi:SNF2 family DNA or RNA helicase
MRAFALRASACPVSLGRQQRNVQAHRFITRGTFEERINEMIRSKRELAEMTVGTGETWVGQLPPEELQALFRLG